MQDPHLRPVPGPTPTDKAHRRAPAAHPFPTDRLKFPKQTEALRAFAVASPNLTTPVGSDQIARLIGVKSAATAGLTTSFFLATGLIKKAGKKYTPVPEVAEFNRRHTLGDDDAPTVLQSLFRNTWYFPAVETRLKFKTATRAELNRALLDEAGAEGSFASQANILIDWLLFVGLIRDLDDTITLADTTPSETTPPVEETDPADTAVPKSTITRQPSDEPVVLSLSVVLSLTASDLAKLTAEQIQALYEAVGKVAAIQANAGL